MIARFPIPCGYVLGPECEIVAEGDVLVVRSVHLLGFREEIGTRAGERWRIFPTHLSAMVYRYLQPRGLVRYLGRDEWGAPLWRVG